MKDDRNNGHTYLTMNVSEEDLKTLLYACPRSQLMETEKLTSNEGPGTSTRPSVSMLMINQFIPPRAPALSHALFSLGRANVASWT